MIKSEYFMVFQSDASRVISLICSQITFCSTIRVASGAIGLNAAAYATVYAYRTTADGAN